MNDDTLGRARATLARLAEAERAATPGPWRAEHRAYGCTTDDDEVSGLGLEIIGPPEPLNRGQFARGADARVIAFGRNALPALLALAEASADAMQWLAVVEGERRDGVIAGFVLDNARREGVAATDRMRAALAALADDDPRAPTAEAAP